MSRPIKRWKKAKRALRRPLETGTFLLLKAIIPLLPRQRTVQLAQTIAQMAMRLPIKKKRLGLRNLDMAYGNSKSDAEKRLILKTSFETIAQTMLDVIWFSRDPETRIPDYVAFEDSPEKELFFQDRPALCITAHMGNWEVMGQTVGLLGTDLASIAATLSNPVIDRILIKQRERTGQTIIPRKGALKSLIARMRKGGKVAFVLDQNTLEEDGGIVVRFMNRPMMVSSAPAALAYRTGTDIFFGFCLPEPGGRYVIQATKCIHPPPYQRDQNAARMAHELTQEIMDVLSAEIMKHPQYWLWAYKHWRIVKKIPIHQKHNRSL